MACLIIYDLSPSLHIKILENADFLYNQVLTNNFTSFLQAIKALKLCCKASWNYVLDLCKLHMTKSHVSHEDLSEKSIADFIMEASDKVAFLLDLNGEDNVKMNGIIRETIICWSNSENLIATLPTPASLIKEWVKVTFESSLPAVALF